MSKNMSRKNSCLTNKSFNQYRLPSSIATTPQNKLPSIHSNCLPETVNNHSNTLRCNNQTSAITNKNYPSSIPTILDQTLTNYDHCQKRCSSILNETNRLNRDEQTPANKGWSSNYFTGFGQSKISNIYKNSTEKSTSKTIIRDHQLAHEILQKAGLDSNLKSSDCLELITDCPVNVNDNVNCDPNPLRMKKSIDRQECYEQPIVVRHLQPSQPSKAAPIIIREHCGPAIPSKPPIIIRQTPPRPSTPPPLIIRECPPSTPDCHQPTIIDREVPGPPAPPRQVIFERMPTPPPKPRPIIFEKWLPYKEPLDRPCIVEKAKQNSIDPPPKNVIIQYEGLEPKIQSQCIDEGISYADPKQLNNIKENGPAEVFYVDQISNLPDHIKRQLSPQALAAIGIDGRCKQTIASRFNVTQTNSLSADHQQTLQNHSISQSTPITTSNRPESSSILKSKLLRSNSATRPCLSENHDNSKSDFLSRPMNNYISSYGRNQYNPWATTYQLSFNNRSRSMCRT